MNPPGDLRKSPKQAVSHCAMEVDNKAAEGLESKAAGGVGVSSVGGGRWAIEQSGTTRA